MSVPAVVTAILLLVGCSKTEPTASSSPSGPPSAPRPRVAEKPTPPLPRAATQRGTAPALPPRYSDANPPGVRRLDGELLTDRGVSYIDEVVGTGRAPEKGKLVKVHYTGWLNDGTSFDSSREREPIAIRFDSGQVIKGWDIGLASMRAGGKRRVIIPGELGYGERGTGDAIPPDSVLVFDIELLEVE